MISRYFSRITGWKYLLVPREIKYYVLPLNLVAVISLHYIFFYVLRYIMISEDKTSSPIVRCSIENVLIEESEIESIESDVEESVPGTPCATCSPIFEVFLKIKPKSKEIPNDEIYVNPNSYEILDSTTLRTRFTPMSNTKRSRTPRPGSTINKKFTFSKIFDWQISQAEFFEQTVKQKVLELLTGQSSTIMTYGATNSGKTYTLYGTPDQPGLIPRSIEYIFSAITCTLIPWYKFNPNNTLMSLDDYEKSDESNKKDRLLRSHIITKEKFTEARRSLENSERSNENKEYYGESMYAVWLSFAEIYNENIYDLLDFDDPTKSRPLKLISEKNGLTHVKGLTTIYATTAFEACQILMAGQSRMSTAVTTLNPKSSRSHTIFTMGLLKYQKAYAPHEVEASTLTFCDLAASGRSKQMDACKTRLAETKNINNSLLVLGRCLKTVYERQSMKQGIDNVGGPFRESKLTRIFQRALSGHEHVTFLIHIDPSSDPVNETQSILNISTIARKIIPEMKESRKSTRELIHCLKTPEIKICLDTSSINEEKGNESTKKIVVKAEKDSTLQDETLKAALLKRELEVREELANHYNNVIERTEKAWKERTKEVEEEGKDLLKWSVDQIESFYKERIDSIIYAKKRKRDELSCGNKDEESRLYEDLQSENIRANSEICALKDTLKKLQDEHRAVLAERNTDNFELALLKKELKDFQDLARSEISLSNFIDGNSDSLVRTFKRLIEDKNRCIQVLQEDLENMTTKYLRTKEDETVSEESFNSKDIIRELKEELSKKSTDIRTLTNNLNRCEKELNQTEEACKDSENKNLLLLRKIEAFDNVMKQIENKCKDSSSPLPPYYLEEPPVKKLDYQLDQNYQNLNSRLSSITDNSFFGDDTVEPGNFIVQAHIDIKKYNFDDTRNLSKGTSSNMSDGERKSLFDSSGNDFRSSDVSSKNDSGIVVGSKFYSKMSELESEILEESSGWVQPNITDRKRWSEYRDKLLFKEKEFERLKEENLQAIEKYKEVSELLDAKSREYERDTYELKEKLKIVEDSKDSILASLKTYAEGNASLECKLSAAHVKLDDIMTDCRENHIQKLRNLEKELLSKTLELDDANNKINLANRDLEKLNDLTERLNKLTIVVDKYQKEKDDLREQLYERSETQAALEKKLKCFYAMIKENNDELMRFETRARIAFKQNGQSYKIAFDLRDDMTKVYGKIVGIESEVQHLNKSRKDIEERTVQGIDDLRSELASLEENTNVLSRTLEDLENKQIELTRIKNRLYEKEQEMHLYKKDRDVTIEKYDFLIRQLQEELEKFRESSLVDKESTNNPARTHPKFRVSESLKKFTRVGKGTDGNWKSAYLGKKSRNEKSARSTSTFSISKVSSSQRTNVRLISDDHELDDSAQSSQVRSFESPRFSRIFPHPFSHLSTFPKESSIDSDESDSRTTSGTSAKTEDDFGANHCRFVRRNWMPGWMRINTRTVSTVYSDVEYDADRSDSQFSSRLPI